MHLATQQRNALAHALKSHLKSGNLSFSGFAESSGINPNTISRLTHPDKFDRVQKDTQRKLERALGSKWNTLIGEGRTDAAPRLVQRANGHVKNGSDKANGATKRMLVVELSGTRVLIAEGLEASILDPTTIRVR